MGSGLRQRGIECWHPYCTFTTRNTTGDAQVKDSDWVEECRKLAERAQGAESISTCSVAMDMHEKLLRTIWNFDVALVGVGGTAAIFKRAINEAQKTCPSLGHIKVSHGGLDFDAFNKHITEAGCAPAEVHRDLLCLCGVIFDIESDLVGETLTKHKLEKL